MEKMTLCAACNRDAFERLTRIGAGAGARPCAHTDEKRYDYAGCYRNVTQPTT